MTAEIAILNKYAVALAADSAVTISTGDKDEKIFDTADKVFELSRTVPIGIMIYNGMDFAEIPLQIIICNFRERDRAFVNVEEAANSFLAYLNEVGVETPESVKNGELQYILSPLFDILNALRRKKTDQYVENFPDDKTGEEVKADIDNIPAEIIAEYVGRFSTYDDATFYGDGVLCFDEAFDEKLDDIMRALFEHNDERHFDELRKLCKLRLTKKVLSNNHTGMIVAGFGTSEIFPTLFSFEIDGIVCNRLKYSKTNSVDIDRVGRRAAVLPFAQKEMVERFLYGMDKNIQGEVARFCQGAIRTITSSLLDRIDLDDEAAKALLAQEAEMAESAFITGLKERAFESIRSTSESEIEMMVEFMPKPELAKMAEALVNLTSIKRKVSRGFETVGGPIDVAVISRTEGFIWVKRKHYFDPALNVRYASRVKSRKNTSQEGHDAKA